MADHWQILGVDHITIAVRDIEIAEKMYVGLLGGVIVPGGKMLDVNPLGHSSMKLCGIRLGGLRLAFVQPINRNEESQVSKFLSVHGEGFQHVAVAVKNLDEFVRDAKKMGFQFLGPILERNDVFGPVRQIFAKKFDANISVAEGMFWEFVERPEGEAIRGTKAQDFSPDFAKEFYRQIEEAGVKDDSGCFFDPMHFSD